MTEVGETEREKSGVDEDVGEPVPEVPDFEPPHDVKTIMLHKKIGRERYREGEPMRLKTSGI